MSYKARSAALFVAILLAIWLPRAVALDRVVTPDEHIWLARSANFYYALAHAEPGGTLQFVHPGVSVMWVGAAAFLLDYPGYFRDAPGYVPQWSDSVLSDFLIEHDRTPLEVLIASRHALVIAHTAILALAFLQAIKLLGRGPATLGMLLIAFNPFHIGLSQILHVDAMTANVMLLSLLALLNYRFRGQRRRDLLISGVAAGLAWLTRSPALFLLPYAGLVMVTGIATQWNRLRHVNLKAWWRLGRPYLAWAGLGVATFILFWPAMWVRPVEILTKMYLVTFRMASEGHELPLFYAGDIVTGDPGAFFYPATYLWRTTPVSLIGLALAGVALAVPRTRLLRPRMRGPILLLLLFGVLFAVLIGFGAKKFDRYLLPAYPPLDLVAGAGWFAAADWLRHQRRSVMKLAAPGLIAVAIGAKAVTTGLAYP
ncbi:MAG TPA: glycosyltransferase family 39 protein, partial [Thermomicrobiales bacterium]|nr:glycosyltransferase family 39 protein [Thermomicrobiales bacterium]